MGQPELASSLFNFIEKNRNITDITRVKDERDAAIIVGEIAEGLLARHNKLNEKLPEKSNKAAALNISLFFDHNKDLLHKFFSLKFFNSCKTYSVEPAPTTKINGKLYDAWLLLLTDEIGAEFFGEHVYLYSVIPVKTEEGYKLYIEFFKPV